MRYVLACLLIVGCASPEEIAQRRHQELMQQQANERTYQNALSNRCSGFGFSAGSREHSNCMMQLHQQNRANSGAAAAAAIQGYAAEEAARRGRECARYGHIPGLGAAVCR